MYEEKALDRIAQDLWARIQPYLENGKILPRLMDTKTTAAYLGISASALWHLKLRGGIPFTQIKGRVMYDRLAIDAWIVQHRKLRRGGASFTRSKR